MSITNLFNSLAGVKKDWREDWNDDATEDWRVDWAVVDDGLINEYQLTPAYLEITSDQVGGYILARPGTWIGQESWSSSNYIFSWRRDGELILDGLSSESYYFFTEEDVGCEITCVISVAYLEDPENLGNWAGTDDYLIPGSVTVVDDEPLGPYIFDILAEAPYSNVGGYFPAGASWTIVTEDVADLVGLPANSNLIEGFSSFWAGTGELSRTIIVKQNGEVAEDLVALVDDGPQGGRFVLVNMAGTFVEADEITIEITITNDFGEETEILTVEYTDGVFG